MRSCAGGVAGGRALHSGDRRETPCGPRCMDLHLLSLSIEARSLRRHSRGCGGCAGPFALPRRQAAAGPGSGRCGGTLRAGRTGGPVFRPLRARCGRVRRCRATGGRSTETRWGARRRLRGDSASAVGAGKKTAYRRSSVARRSSASWSPLMPAGRIGLALDRPPAVIARPDWVTRVRPWGARILRSQVLDENRLGLDAAAYRAEQQRKLAELAQLNLTHHIGALFGYGLELADPAQRIAASYDATAWRWLRHGLRPRLAHAAVACAGPARVSPRGDSPLSGCCLTPQFCHHAPSCRARFSPRGRASSGRALEPAALAAAEDRPAVIVTAGEMLVRGQRTSGTEPTGDVLLGGPGAIVEVKPAKWLPERVRFEFVAPDPALRAAGRVCDGWRASLDGPRCPSCA